MNSLSKVDIANFALHLIGGGGKPLLSLDEDKKEAKIISRLYPGTKESVLAEEQAKWSFAIKRLALDDSAETNNTHYSKNYALPADCIRPLRIKDHENYPFEVEAGILYCDVGDAMLIYIANVDDESAFTPGFARALAHKLAIDIAEFLEKDSTALWQKYIIALRSAIGQDNRGRKNKIPTRSYTKVRFDYRRRGN